jgi:ribonuclease E
VQELTGEEAVQTASAAEGEAGNNEASTEQRAPRERRSRDRYGRDRRERGPRDAQAQAGEEVATDAETNAEPVSVDRVETAVQEEVPARSSYFSMPVETAPAAVAAVAAVGAASVASAPAVEESIPPVETLAVAPPTRPATPAAASQPEAALTPVVEAPAVEAVEGLPKIAAYALPMDAMSEVARSSGLEWVNSDADRVAQVQAAIAAEPKPIHVPREIKPVVLVDEGPLVLVETRIDLSKVTLPFEGTPTA